MERLNGKTTEVAARWVRKIGLAAMDKWPPDCAGAVFQAQRPARPEGKGAEPQAGKKARL